MKFKVFSSLYILIFIQLIVLSFQKSSNVYYIKMEISPPDSWQSLFETPSFVLIIRNVKITHDTIYNIYLKSKSFTNSLKNFVISEKQFDINFEEEQGETVRIMLNQESIFFLALENVLKKPFEVIFEEMKSKIKK